jgi:MFS family permease
VWGTTYVVRFFHWTPGKAGAVVGTLGAVVSLGGTWLGGRMSDYLSTRNARWLLLLPALGLLFASPCTVTAAFAPTIVWLFAASSGEAFFRTITLAPAAAALQRLAPNDARARAAATAGVVGTLVGLGVGPVLVGAISDNLAPQFGQYSLQYGLAAMVIPQLLAAYCFWRASQTLREDLEEAKTGPAKPLPAPPLDYPHRAEAGRCAVLVFLVRPTDPNNRQLLVPLFFRLRFPPAVRSRRVCGT